MTKQEKIQKGIYRIIRHWGSTVRSADWQPLYRGTTVEQDIVLYLHSQGVVIKVDRAKSPDDFVAVEPLIKEEK